MLAPDPAPGRLRSTRPSALVRRFALWAVGLCALLAALSAAPPAVASTTPAPAPAARARAWIVVDVGTGAVLDAGNAREPVGVASTAKLLTALVVRRKVPLDDRVPISAHAEAMPALKMNLKAGQVWNANDLVHCMLLASANDSAVALAERAGGGTLDGFEPELADEARLLGLSDRPVLRDPAGLDDEFSVSGGNLISARDLAIAARAFLADPYLAAIVRQPEYRFEGGDGAPHHVVAHNPFMRTYAGAVGVKTGYTEKSGSSLVAAARRGDRTLLAVVLHSTNADAMASSLLDAAFAARPPAHPADRLPAVPAGSHVAGSRAAGLVVASALTVRRSTGSSAASGVGLAVSLLVVLVFGVAVRRRQVVVRRRGPGRHGRGPGGRPRSAQEPVGAAGSRRR